ncbi:membrane protease YdiL (CAAX protease family) [Pseudoclavibacter sp. JAI123]|uniref:CPBP family glutamic-type intramembrane protease n=1 Tax=Pseudoclavibacter sp. JAI123 TaxID=2723065 RepID=UPI0015CC96C2|nr:CPBP family glutamic-type intramembrane protease [Pseudoclavibacter sp. JAI123]NYF14367.1 membrane protease YdiL (CAAX protease family) [Pseudoclavibacter sp. JAI123]
MAGAEHGRRRVATLGRGVATTRALVAAAVMATGLVVSTEVSSFLFGVDATAASGFGSRVLVACCVTLIVVGVILLLRCRWDRRSLAGIGLTGLRADASGFALGLGTLVAAGLAMLLALEVTGVVSLIALDPVRLLGFLATNTVVALLLEAVPEELAIRGYALTNLRDAFPPAPAALLNIATFLVVPILAITFQGALAAARGTGDEVLLAPAGEDPIVYYTMLTAFGYLLICARDATASATVWTSIGAHLGWLTMNRLVLGGESVQYEMDDLGMLLFFAGYATISVIAFSWLRRRHSAAR